MASAVSLIASRLRRGLEYFGRANALEEYLAGWGCVAFPVDPAPAQLERGEVQRARDLRGLHLGRELGLRRAKTAEGAVGRRIGGHRTTPDAYVLAPIRPPGVQHAPAQDDGRERRVSPAVHHDLDVLGKELAVTTDAGPMANDRGVALGGGADVLVAVVDHPHRFVALEREKGRVEGDAGGVF